MTYQTHVLPNGIKIIHKKFASSVAHCGLIINAGSRDEKKEEHGLAHFIEHALFKGTCKRKAHHIINRLENVGGEINAYTTKEETCIYSSFLKDDLERSMDLTSDLVFNSTFPEKELKKEREIIIDEINSYKDSPSELIFDEFEELVFKDDPLGRNILGTSKYLRKFSAHNIRKFISNNYHTNQIVFSVVGDYDFKKVTRLAEKYLGGIEANLSNKDRILTNNYQPLIRKVKKNTHQAHCIMGNLAYGLKHHNRLGLVLLNNLIGGPGMNSKMNIALREKSGYAYNTESFYSSYTETGLFGVYFGTDKENLFKCIDLVMKEFEKLRKNKLGQIQLNKAKRQLLGQIAISSENKENYMLVMGKSMLVFDKVDSLEEISMKIDAITENIILEIANEILHPEKLSTLIYT
jgi:predicted Zn-dependent peptidase